MRELEQFKCFECYGLLWGDWGFSEVKTENFVGNVARSGCSVRVSMANACTKAICQFYSASRYVLRRSYCRTSIHHKSQLACVTYQYVMLLCLWTFVLFCSLVVLDPRVCQTMDLLSPFIPVFCHSDWLFHGKSCPRLDVVHPDCACVHLALFLALSLSPGNSLVSSWCDHSMLASLLWRCLTVPSLLQLC